MDEIVEEEPIKNKSTPNDSLQNSEMKNINSEVKSKDKDEDSEELIFKIKSNNNLKLQSDDEIDEEKFSEPLEIEKSDKLLVKKQTMRVIPDNIREGMKHIQIETWNSLLVNVTLFVQFVREYIKKRKQSLFIQQNGKIQSKQALEKKQYQEKQQQFSNQNTRSTRNKQKVNYCQDQYSDEMQIESEPSNSNEQYSEEQEQQQEGNNWEDACAICEQEGEVICCDTCDKVYHLKCLDLKETPVGDWSCLSCYENIQKQRQTRSRKPLQNLAN